MSEIYKIPVIYQEGIYDIQEMIKIFKSMEDSEDVIELHYKKYGDIITYEVPDNGREIVIYGIPKDEFEHYTKAVYDADGELKKMTADIKNKNMLFYIHYESQEVTMQEVQNFAIKNAENIVGKIGMEKSVCNNEKISRLFIEYFDDGEYMDFHVKIGTESQKNELKKKYRRSKDIVDSCGDYQSEVISGDNDALKIMIQCADYEETDYFQYAVNIMTEYIKEQAVKKLNQAKDFKIISGEYD